MEGEIVDDSCPMCGSPRLDFGCSNHSCMFIGIRKMVGLDIDHVSCEVVDDGPEKNINLQISNKQ